MCVCVCVCVLYCQKLATLQLYLQPVLLYINTLSVLVVFTPPPPSFSVSAWSVAATRTNLLLACRLASQHPLARRATKWSMTSLRLQTAPARNVQRAISSLLRDRAHRQLDVSQQLDSVVLVSYSNNVNQCLVCFLAHAHGFPSFILVRRLFICCAYADL